MLFPARRLAIDREVARQKREITQDLFDKFKGLQIAGLPISMISQQPGFNRRRFDKWAKLSDLPERNKCNRAQPTLNYSASTFGSAGKRAIEMAACCWARFKPWGV